MSVKTMSVKNKGKKEERVPQKRHPLFSKEKQTRIQRYRSLHHHHFYTSDRVVIAFFNQSIFAKVPILLQTAFFVGIRVLDAVNLTSF